MEVDCTKIGERIARRRKQLQLKQAEVEEKADLSYKYLSIIERGISIPSLEVIVRLAIALDTTPDEFLVGTRYRRDEKWKKTAEKLRHFNGEKLWTVDCFVNWISEQDV